MISIVSKLELSDGEGSEFTKPNGDSTGENDKPLQGSAVSLLVECVLNSNDGILLLYEFFIRYLITCIHNLFFLSFLFLVYV